MHTAKAQLVSQKRMKSPLAVAPTKNGSNLMMMNGQLGQQSVMAMTRNNVNRLLASAENEYDHRSRPVLKNEHDESDLGDIEGDEGHTLF